MKCGCGLDSDFVSYSYDINGRLIGLKCPSCKPPKNNIMSINRGEMARPNSSKPVSMARYENEIRQGCYCLMFLEDPGDARLVEDMLRSACLTNVTHPSNPGVYDCIIKLWECHKFPEPKCIRRKNQEANIIFSLKTILFGLYGYAHHICGADLEILEDLCSLTRSLDEDHNLKTQIAFIGNQNSSDRHKAFKNAYELGDIVININAIKDDPMEILKLMPSRYPREEILKRIISDEAI
jgi:hypothetical protein